MSPEVNKENGGSSKNHHLSTYDNGDEGGAERQEFERMVRRKQIMIFSLSYLVHMLSELGLTNELVTSTFYKQVIGTDSKDPNEIAKDNNFKYSNMQVVLLTVSCMYFFLGCTLEYTRKSWYFIAAISLLLGGLKIGVS
jgi:hypothetical protein